MASRRVAGRRAIGSTAASRSGSAAAGVARRIDAQARSRAARVVRSTGLLLGTSRSSRGTAAAMPGSVSTLEPLRLRLMRRDRDAREIRHDRALFHCAAAGRCEAAGAPFSSHESRCTGPRNNSRELDETALEFEKTIATRVAREAQPCEAVAAVHSARIGIALNDHDDRARVPRRFANSAACSSQNVFAITRSSNSPLRPPALR